MRKEEDRIILCLKLELKLREHQKNINKKIKNFNEKKVNIKDDKGTIINQGFIS